MLVRGGLNAAASASALAQQQQQQPRQRISSSRRAPQARSRARKLTARASVAGESDQQQQPPPNELQQQRPPNSFHAGGEASTSGGGGGNSPSAAVAARRAFAAAASSLAVILPGGGMGGGLGGGGGGGGWWGGAGGWWGGAGGGDGAAAGGGAAAAAALYELAAAGDDDGAGGGAAKKRKKGGGKKKKKKGGGNLEDEDPNTMDLLRVGRPGPRAAKTGAGAGAGAGAAGGDGLITDESDLEDALDELDGPERAAAAAAAAAAREEDAERAAAEPGALAFGGADEPSLEGRPRCAEVGVEGWPEVGSLPRVEELRDTLTVQEGFAFDEDDLRADAARLQNAYKEYLSGVSFRVEPLDGPSPAAPVAGGAPTPPPRVRVVYSVRPFKFDAIQLVEIRGATLMPRRVCDEIAASVLPSTGPYRVDVGVLDSLRAKIEKWYQSRGLPFCYVGFFDGMDEGTLRANVVEAKVVDVTVRYRGHTGEPARPERKSKVGGVQGGDVVPPERIVKASGFKKGQHYHIDDGQVRRRERSREGAGGGARSRHSVCSGLGFLFLCLARRLTRGKNAAALGPKPKPKPKPNKNKTKQQDAMNSIYSCGLLEEVSVDPEQDPKDPSKIHVRINVQEAAPRSMELSLDWALPLQSGVPRLGRQALVPGGSVELTHENLFGNSESFSLSLSSSDWRNPAADLGYTMSFTEPFYAPRTTRNAQVRPKRERKRERERASERRRRRPSARRNKEREPRPPLRPPPPPTPPPTPHQPPTHPHPHTHSPPQH